MTDRNYTTALTVEQSPEAVFSAITNPRGWWSEEIVGRTDRRGEIFDYHFRDIHRCRIEVTELVPGKRVAWHVLENHFNFIQDQREWTGTDIVFDINRSGGKTALQFTHVGLVPDDECFEICADAWGTYIRGSLRLLITTGKGLPNVGEPMTTGERALASAPAA